MIQVCPICEQDINIPEVDGEEFKCPHCEGKLQVFNISGVWEVYRSMGKVRDEYDE